MAVTTNWYGNAFKNYLSGVANSSWDWDTDTIKISLHTATYAPNLDTHDFYDDVTNEVSSAGYTAGGATLANKTVTVDTGNNQVEFDADDVSWTGVSFTTRYAVVYKSTGTASTSPLIAVIDFGADQTVSGVNFSIIFSSDGVIRATY
jgi:hypothetical protein